MHTLTISNGGEITDTVEGSLDEVSARLNATMKSGEYTLMIHLSPTGISTHYRNKKCKS